MHFINGNILLGNAEHCFRGGAPLECVALEISQTKTCSAQLAAGHCSGLPLQQASCLGACCGYCLLAAGISFSSGENASSVLILDSLIWDKTLRGSRSWF